MKKILTIITLALTMVETKASVTSHQEDSLQIQPSANQSYTHIPDSIDYGGLSVASDWNGHWFVEAKAGASAFLGTPIGYGNIFDRTRPAIQIGVGKWVTPTIGGRIMFQGFRFMNARLETMRYQFIHADLLYNVTNRFSSKKGESHWDVIPFVGMGLIHNSDWTKVCKCSGSVSADQSFAFSYGIQARYRLCKRIHLLAEVSGMNTFAHFDGVGTSSKFGDNMINLTAGISYTIGETSWRKKGKIRPRSNQQVRHSKCQSVERHKQKPYQSVSVDSLTSFMCKEGVSKTDTLKSRNLSSDIHLGDSVLERVSTCQSTKDTICIGIPVYFYFRIGSHTLVDPLQRCNLDELARIAKAQNAEVCICGAADRATGNEALNLKLSRSRAEYIAQEFLKRGISSSWINVSFKGGVCDFIPAGANRNTCVIITKPQRKE